MNFDALLVRLGEARNSRANWETIWQDIADRVLPELGDFTIRNQQPGARRTEKMYDASATLAARRAQAAITSFFWPSNQRYQRLSPEGDESVVSQAVKEYLDAFTDRLFQVRYSPRSTFEAQMDEVGLSFMVFGTGVLFIDDMMSNPAIRQPGILYKSVPLAQIHIQENAAGKIDTVHRVWRWSLRQIAQQFPGKLPADLASKAATSPDTQIEIAHSVMPREDYNSAMVGTKARPWASVYYLPAQKALLEEGGFWCFPYAVLRFMTAPGEIYGRSPAWLAMSNIRVLNTQKRTLLAAAQKVVDPPLLGTEDGPLGGMNQAPGAFNLGALSPSGEPLVKSLLTGARVDIGIEMMDKEREIVSSAFFLDVFRALVENPQMTATQAQELMQERASLMAPIGGRIESEGFGPMTTMEVDILTRARQAPPNMPPELVAQGGRYQITYTSPMRQAMRAGEGIAITRTMEAIAPIAALDPTVMEGFAPMAVVGRELGEINGMPSKLLASLEDIQAKREARQQQQDAQSMVDAAQPLSAAAANLTKLQAAGGRPQV